MYTGKGINRILYQEITQRLDGSDGHHCEYVYGEKPPIDADTSTVDGSDCSGYDRYKRFKTVADMPSDYPQGSQDQHNWCKENLIEVPYAVAKQDRTNRIFACYIQGPSNVPENQVRRHAFDLQNGETNECCAGDGVCCSANHADYYTDQVWGCFEWPTYLPEAA